MDLVAFYQHILSPPAPWHVPHVECDDHGMYVDVRPEHAPAKFRGDHCMAGCAVYNHASKQLWRHLNSHECQTFIHAYLLREKYHLCGVADTDVMFAPLGLSVTLPLKQLGAKTLRERTMANGGGMPSVTPHKLRNIREKTVRNGNDAEHRKTDVPKMTGLMGSSSLHAAGVSPS